LLLALGARVFYAYGLPLSYDEVQHLRTAREISLRPESFNLPLDSPGTSHALGAVYLTALYDWAGGGNVFVIRLAFIAMSMFGLVGLYVLGSSLFDSRVALIALALAAVDRSLVALAGVFLECPAVISLAPWTILFMHKCVAQGRARDWLLTGLLFGLGYWLSTVFLAMLLPFGLHILFAGRLVRVLKSPWMYIGLAVMFAMMSPTVIGEFLSGWANQERNVDKLGSLGLSPRMALLYIGDLLICLKDPTWIVQNIGDKMYLPTYVPCHWVMGLVYIALVSVSFRFWRDERIRLLLLVIVGFAIPVTLIDARESWNEFTWASLTVFAAILLTAFVIDRTLSGKWGNASASVVLAYALAAMLWFLAGPKWGYFCPEWQRAYVGRVLALGLRSGYSPTQFSYAQTAGTIRELTDQVLAQHPESVMAWYFRGLHAETATERQEAFARVLTLDPNNPLVASAMADSLAQAGDWAGAKTLLQALLADSGESIKVLAAMAEVEYQLGNYDSAIAHVRRLVALNPIEPEPYGLLFNIYDAMGEEAKAEASFQDYVARHPEGPAAAYLQLAEQFLRATVHDRRATSSGQTGPRNLELAIRLATQASQLTEWKDPESLRVLAMAHRAFGASLADRGEFEAAIHNYRKALETNSDDVAALFDLAFLLAMCPDEELRNPVEAIRLAETGCHLTKHSDAFGLTILAATYAQVGRLDTAINTLEKALRLAQAAGDAKLATQLRFRLKQYREGKVKSIESTPTRTRRNS
jgi:tetratricopeptide (TPR) repeat protein